MGNVGDVPNVEIPVHWMPVLVKGKHFHWHEQKLSEAAKRQIAGPQVYRWLLRTRSGEVLTYIGQTENFETRLRAYRSGSASSFHSHVRAAIEQCIGDGGAVELNFLDLESGAFRIHGKLISHRSLFDYDVRMAMEGIAIMKASADGETLLNRLRKNAVESMMARLLKQYSADVLKSALERMQASIEAQVRDN